MFRREGFTEDRQTLVYCQGAASSVHQLSAPKPLDYHNVKNYVGSWKEWGNSERPIEDIPRVSRSPEAKLVALGALALGALLPVLIYAVSNMKGGVSL